MNLWALATILVFLFAGVITAGFMSGRKRLVAIAILLLGPVLVCAVMMTPVPTWLHWTRDPGYDSDSWVPFAMAGAVWAFMSAALGLAIGKVGRSIVQARRNRGAIIVMGIAGVLILVAAPLLLYQNMGRFGSREYQTRSTEAIVADYAAEGTIGRFDCDVQPKAVSPQRYPKSFSEIYSGGGPAVWEFDWTCRSSDDTVDGILVIFPNGNTVWAGTSSKRGDLSTHEF